MVTSIMVIEFLDMFWSFVHLPHGKSFYRYDVYPIVQSWSYVGTVSQDVYTSVKITQGASIMPPQNTSKYEAMNGEIIRLFDFEGWYIQRYRNVNGSQQGW